MQDPSFIEMIDRIFGGALATLFGAFTGRLMYHSGEVKLGRRRFFGRVGNPGCGGHGAHWRGGGQFYGAHAACLNRVCGDLGLSRPARCRGALGLLALS